MMKVRQCGWVSRVQAIWYWNRRTILAGLCQFPEAVLLFSGFVLYNSFCPCHPKPCLPLCLHLAWCRPPLCAPNPRDGKYVWLPSSYPLPPDWEFCGSTVQEPVMCAFQTNEVNGKMITGKWMNCFQTFLSFPMPLTSIPNCHLSLCHPALESWNSPLTGSLVTSMEANGVCSGVNGPTFDSWPHGFLPGVSSWQSTLPSSNSVFPSIKLRCY